MVVCRFYACLIQPAGNILGCRPGECVDNAAVFFMLFYVLKYVPESIFLRLYIVVYVRTVKAGDKNFWLPEFQPLEYILLRHIVGACRERNYGHGWKLLFQYCKLQI